MIRLTSCSARLLEPSLGSPVLVEERDPLLVRDRSDADLDEGIVCDSPSLKAHPEATQTRPGQAPISSSSSAFWAWRRFSAWSQIRWRSP